MARRTLQDRKSAEKTKPRVKREQNYLDARCELFRRSDGTFRMTLQLTDWTMERVDLSTHRDFAGRDVALSDVAAAIVMFKLRACRRESGPNCEVWRNRPSREFQRAIWRVQGRCRQRHVVHDAGRST